MIQVARAKALLAVAPGHSHTAAAHQAGRVSDDAMAHLVARFNGEGLLAVPLGIGVTQRYATRRLTERLTDIAQPRPQ